MRDGEIWEIELGNGTRKYTVVVRDHGDYCTVLHLTEDEKPDMCEVQCRQLMYTDCGKMQYCFNCNFIEFVRKMTDAEYQALMVAIAKRLGIEAAVKTVEKEKSVEKSVEVVRPDPETESALEKAATELEVYKSLYRELLNKCMAKAGWC